MYTAFNLWPPVRRPLPQALCPVEVIAHSSIDTDFGSRVLKVNHAGEHGAINIYAGQIFAARLTAKQMVEELIEFQSHELKHRAIFLAELQRRDKPSPHKK